MFGGVEENGSHLEGAVDEVGVEGGGMEEALEGEVEGEGREVREAEEGVEEVVDVVVVVVEPKVRVLLGGAGSFRHRRRRRRRTVDEGIHLRFQRVVDIVTLTPQRHRERERERGGGL